MNASAGLPGLENILAQLPGGDLGLALVGAALLLAGRRLFWLVLVAVGFLVGLSLAVRFLDAQPPLLVLAVGLVTGMVAAGLAIFVQKLAVALAGFAVGGYAALWAFQRFALELAVPEWVLFVAGGLLVGLGAVAVLEWALVVVSAVAGTILILNAIDLPAHLSLLALVVLTLIGCAVQAQGMKRQD